MAPPDQLRRPPRDRVMIGARIPRELANHLRLAATKRVIDGQPHASIAAIVEDALKSWLRRHGYLEPDDA